MAKLLIYASVLAVLVGAVVAVDLGRRYPVNSAVAGVAGNYVECAAYYQVTADILERDGDEESVGQYRDWAAMVLAAGAHLVGRSVLEMRKEQNQLAATLASSLSIEGKDLGDLASRYDDQCVALLDE